MSQSFKICPICDNPAHRNATICSTCGTTLTDVEPITVETRVVPITQDYDPHFGETDLLENNLQWRGGNYILGIVLIIAILVCIGTISLIGIRIFGHFPLTEIALTPLTSPPTQLDNNAASTISPLSDNGVDLVTNTPRPTILLVTVTPAPPTPTATETPGPCMQQVALGDDLIAIISRCGHKNLDVIDLVLEINNISDPSLLQAGQVLEIPWPTPTLDPNAETTEESTVNAAIQGDADSPGAIALIEDRADLNLGTPTASPTATLQPGVMWHRIISNETILSIAYNYGANVEILSQLNPEITFSQCDFGEFTGGESCTVQIYEGQLIRVPAPTPTATLSPTPSGSETSTPTITPTFNAPSPLSPPDRALFQRDELVTLRWIASGTLGENQVYHVSLKDETAGVSYTATTQELFFIIPTDWQGQDEERHMFEWKVSIVDLSTPDVLYFATEPQTFIWLGMGKSE